MTCNVKGWLAGLAVTETWDLTLSLHSLGLRYQSVGIVSLESWSWSSQSSGIRLGIGTLFLGRLVPETMSWSWNHELRQILIGLPLNLSWSWTYSLLLLDVSLCLGLELTVFSCWTSASVLVLNFTVLFLLLWKQVLNQMCNWLNQVITYVTWSVFAYADFRSTHISCYLWTILRDHVM